MNKLTDGFQVFIDKQGWGLSTSLLFVERRNGKTYIAKPVELIFEEAKEDDYIEQPTMRLSNLYSEQLFKALAEALDQHGTKTDNDFKIHGLLEATKYHLSDLRRLLKLP